MRALGKKDKLSTDSFIQFLDKDQNCHRCNRELVFLLGLHLEWYHYRRLDAKVSSNDHCNNDDCNNSHHFCCHSWKPIVEPAFLFGTRACIRVHILHIHIILWQMTFETWFEFEFSFFSLFG